MLNASHELTALASRCKNRIAENEKEGFDGESATERLH
jgi:hypothetical protein